MELKIAPNDVQSMSQDGDAILRSLQNRSLPVIDLMVREALQNSLDAARENEKVTRVEFKVGTFQSESFTKHLRGIQTTLEERYPLSQEFLSISDKDTEGLTGDYQSTDPEILDQSNFHKLVFGIGKNQDKEGAGGSWGLGKTSFFRLGIGIVIYYTRIKTEMGYEERLIASLIESPKQKKRLLSEGNRGIAWWGRYDDSREKIFPIVDSNKIQEILDIFELESYSGTDTGTTIIVPYLNPLNAEGGLSDDHMLSFPWEYNRTEAIEMAVQRWYFPRILNTKYEKVLGNSSLECKVNDKLLVPKLNFEPIFNIYQKIYTAALLGKSEDPKIQVEEIKFKRNVMEDKDEPIGYIAFCEVGPEELRMIPPNNKPSGLTYLGIKDESKLERNNSKVIAYSRKPGMVVEYSVDGPWVPSEMIHDEKKLLLGFFVPHSNSALSVKYQEEGYKSVESYLRATENSDHAAWTDQAGIGIINRMKVYSAKAIKDAYIDSEVNSNITATSVLSRKYGSLFMPPENYGSSSSRKESDQRLERKVESRTRLSDVQVVQSLPINEFTVEVDVKIFLQGNTTSTLFLQVLTQDQKMDYERWVKGMGSDVQFPVHIENMWIQTINGEDISTEIQSLTTPGYKFILNTPWANQLDITSNKDIRTEIDGTLIIKAHSNLYIPNIAIRKMDIRKQEDKNHAQHKSNLSL